MRPILIAEDERPIADLIELTLTSAGYACEQANDGETAADLIAEHDYELAVLDIMLPGIDGYELLRYLHSTGTPVIFVTAKTSLQDRVRGLNLGADDYLTKPFERWNWSPGWRACCAAPAAPTWCCGLSAWSWTPLPTRSAGTAGLCIWPRGNLNCWNC